MLIVRYIGGLGNQLFQYAFAQELRRRGYNVYEDVGDFAQYKKHQGFELTKVFDVTIEYAPKKYLDRLKRGNSIFERIKAKLFLKNKKTHLSQAQINIDSLSKNKDFYLDGYWQDCSSYIIRNELRTLIKFKKPSLNKRNEKLFYQINSSNSIGVHVRRGDYLNKENVNHFENIGQEYYHKAKKIITKEMGSDIKFFFFSDDIDYVKSEFNWGEEEAVFVDWNLGENSYLDMYMMAHCQGLIIPNSTFSWWAGVLVKEKKVISPKYWWKDRKRDNDVYLPENWYLINNRNENNYSLGI
ncbi:alpha-1,2-fucosyltransferase [Marinilabilia salmonicolor]|uniref:Glycosyl transferase family 11 n=1 Tax=Marinilabilia salmonicolor TaxID=989 RepID=A0A368URN0_9BACT|nr:alpha-1,2-fucosyltransferase [Marinilabilia salmonicolor]RCW30044.1 glycosyl transferase family 11 [Marinilabilia salmonicolor]